MVKNLALGMGLQLVSATLKTLSLQLNQQSRVILEMVAHEKQRLKSSLPGHRWWIVQPPSYITGYVR